MAINTNPIAQQSEVVKMVLYAYQADGSLAPATIGGGGGGSGTVTSVATSSPITGGPISTTGTIGCPTCTTNAAALANGNLVNGAGGQATVDSGIASSTLVTSASSLTSNAFVLGAGSQGSKTVAGITSDGTSQLNLGVNGTVAGFLNLLGATSGNQTISTNATGTQVLLKAGATLTIPGSSSGTFTLAPNSTGSQLSLSGSINVGGIAASGSVAAGGFTAVSTGAPVQVYNATTGGSSASIGATTMLANPAADRNFIFHVYIGQVAAGTTCSVAGSVAVNVIYTDSVTGNVYTFVVPLETSGGTSLGASIPLSTSTPTVANVGSGVFRLRAKASTNVQFSTTYTQGTCSSGSPTYFIAPVLEAL